MVQVFREDGKVRTIELHNTIYIHMKKNELTHIIQEIVAEEIRRELPMAIAEVFQKFMGQKPMVTERVVQPTPSRRPEPQDEFPNEEINLKQSLREMFAGTSVMTKPKPAGPIKFAKNPVLNEILNQTRPFSSQERMGAPAGTAAMMAASQAGLAMPGYMESPLMMESVASEPAFMRNMPNMGSMMSSHNPISPPISQAALLRDDHAPLADLPQGVSVMDVKQHAPASVAGALTRNYSQMMKLIDKKKGKPV